jgi:hypothetical protein
MRRKEPWPNIAQIIDAGGQLHVVTHDYGTCISSLESDGQMVCMTQTNGENFTSVMDAIEAMAKRYNEEGIITDQVNGNEENAW